MRRRRISPCGRNDNAQKAIADGFAVVGRAGESGGDFLFAIGSDEEREVGNEHNDEVLKQQIARYKAAVGEQIAGLDWIAQPGGQRQR